MNLFKQFQSVSQDQGLRFIGEVTAVNGTNCTVTLTPGGASLEVSGVGRSLVIGQRWIVQAGKIIGEAPSGAVINIEV